MLIINKKSKITTAILLYITLSISIPYTTHAYSHTPLNITTNRLNGANRFETAVSISKDGWINSDNVILVNAYNFPDALAGVISDTVIDSIKNQPEKGSPYGNISNFGYAVQKEDWIYFSVIDDTNSIDSGGYYPNGYPGGIYKMKLDGSNKTKLLSVKANFLNIKDDWIYYRNESDESKLYKIKIDGTFKTKLTDFPAYNINIAEDWIFYISKGKTGMLKR